MEVRQVWPREGWRSIPRLLWGQNWGQKFIYYGVRAAWQQWQNWQIAKGRGNEHLDQSVSKVKTKWVWSACRWMTQGAWWVWRASQVEATSVSPQQHQLQVEGETNFMLCVKCVLSSPELGRHPAKCVESAGGRDESGSYNNLSKAVYLC